VRGVRINVSPIHPPERDFAATLLPRIERLEARCASLAGTAICSLPGWLTTSWLDRLRNAQVDFTLPTWGCSSRRMAWRSRFSRLLGLLRNGDGAAWSSSPAFTALAYPRFCDAARWHRSARGRADRMLWGSDYPHLSFADKVGAGGAFSCPLRKLAPDAHATRQAVLSESCKAVRF